MGEMYSLTKLIRESMNKREFLSLYIHTHTYTYTYTSHVIKCFNTKGLYLEEQLKSQCMLMKSAIYMCVCNVCVDLMT